VDDAPALRQRWNLCSGELTLVDEVVNDVEPNVEDER